MKGFTCCLLIFFSILVGCNTQAPHLKDIDGNSYRIIQVNGIMWMAEDLRVTRDRNKNEIQYYVPNSDTANIPSYGLLYDFENACKVCPEGWRLPTNAEWEGLLDYEGLNEAKVYKDVGYWKGETNTNLMNFSIRPSGIGNNQEHPNQFQKKVLYWSNDIEDDHFIWTYIFEHGSDSIRKASQHPTYAFSVRCVKEKN